MPSEAACIPSIILGQKLLELALYRRDFQSPTLAPAHLSVESKVAKSRVSCESAIFIHHHLLKVVADCDANR